MTEPTVTGVSGLVACRDCGVDAGKQRCDRCWARRRVVRVLCDRDSVTDVGAAVVDVVCDRTPRHVTRWLRRHPELVATLRRVAAGEMLLTHGHLDDVPSKRSVEFFRRQLIQAGLLPEQNHQLAMFDIWVRDLLASIEHPARRQQVATFATWHHRRRLVTAIDNGTIRPSSTRGARGQINVTIRFLDWLDDRGRSLAECTQDDLDAWFAEGNTTRLNAISFITWARTQQLCRPNLRVPVPPSTTPTGMPHDDRIVVIGRLLRDDTIDTADRVAGLLVALYAQPVTRISSLPAAAVSIDGRTTIQLGDERLDLAEPVGQLMQRHVTEIGTSEWLFPGRTPGRPRSAHGLAERITRHGVTRAARIGALHDLVQQIPSPVLAELIDYNPEVIAKRATALAAPWEHYAALRGRAEPTQPAGTTEALTPIE